MQIFIGVSPKWICRIALPIFYIVGLALQITGTDFFGWMVRDHIYWTTAIIFLTIVTFVSPFLHIKRKTKDGGEKELRKLAWFVIIVFGAVLAIAIACAVNDPFKASVISTLTGIGGPVWLTLSNGWSNFATVIGTSGTHFLIYTVGMLFAGGILFVALTRLRNKGKIPFMHAKQTTPADMGYQDVPTPQPMPIPQTKKTVPQEVKVSNPTEEELES